MKMLRRSSSAIAKAIRTRNISTDNIFRKSKLDHSLNIFFLLTPKTSKVVQISAFDKTIINYALRRIQKLNNDRIESFKDTCNVLKQMYQLQLATALSQKSEIKETPATNLKDFFFPIEHKFFSNPETDLVRKRTQDVDIVSAFFGLIISNMNIGKDTIVRHPRRIQRYTVLKSPHTDKKARSQFEMRNHAVTYNSPLNFLSEEVLHFLSKHQVMFHITENIK